MLQTAAVLPLALLTEFMMMSLLLAVFYQDMKERAVSVYLFLLLFIAGGARYYLSGAGYEVILVNGSFIILQMSVLVLYCLLRFRSANVFRFFGQGDLLFWGVLSLLFSPVNFIAFFLTSIMLSFGLHYFLLRWQKNLHQTVPLAGFQSLLLMFVLGFCQFYPAWNPYEDLSLLTFTGLV